MNILLSGGAGYIGSHTAVDLISKGHQVIIADDFSNSEPDVAGRIEKITGVQDIPVYECDLKNKRDTAVIFASHDIDCVIHFAGFKAVGESTKVPLKYYRNNIDTTLTLLECMEDAGVNNFVFSSSATVYGEENPIPYKEDMPRGKCSSTYGKTKAMIEEILEDAASANPDLHVVILRYFNPIGAHKSGLIGEAPQGIPNNLMPYITQVASGRLEKLTVFGDDYDTPDGSCRRDYIHIMDLADGHSLAMDYAMKNSGVEVFNLGTGRPFSVLELVKTFEAVNNIEIPFVIGERRAGDLPEFWADSSKAEAVLGWRAKSTIEDMCRDSWNWENELLR